MGAGYHSTQSAHAHTDARAQMTDWCTDICAIIIVLRKQLEISLVVLLVVLDCSCVCVRASRRRGDVAQTDTAVQLYLGREHSSSF